MWFLRFLPCLPVSPISPRNPLIPLMPCIPGAPGNPGWPRSPKYIANIHCIRFYLKSHDVSIKLLTSKNSDFTWVCNTHCVWTINWNVLAIDFFLHIFLKIQCFLLFFWIKLKLSTLLFTLMSFRAHNTLHTSCS